MVRRVVNDDLSGIGSGVSGLRSGGKTLHHDTMWGHAASPEDRKFTILDAVHHFTEVLDAEYVLEMTVVLPSGGWQSQRMHHDC